MNKRTMQEAKTKCVTIANNVETHMNQKGVQPMVKAVQDMGE